MCGYFASINVCVLLISLVPLEARRGSQDPPHPSWSWTVVSCLVSAENWIWAPCNKQPVFATTEPPLQFLALCTYELIYLSMYVFTFEARVHSVGHIHYFAWGSLELISLLQASEVLGYRLEPPTKYHLFNETLLLSFIFTFYFVHISVLSLYLCGLCVPGVCGGQEKSLGFMRLELQTGATM